MSLLLESFKIADTRDPDEAQAILCRELSNLKLESVEGRGQFRFLMNGVHLGRTTIGFNRFSTRTVVDAGVIENVVILSLNFGPTAVVDIDGQPVGRDEFAIVSPYKRTKIHRDPGSGVVLVRAGMDAVEARFRELTGHDPPGPLVFDRSVSLENGVGAQIRQVFAYLIDDANNADSVLGNPVLRAGLDDMLLSAILAVPHNYRDLLMAQPRVPVDLKLVRQAEEYLQAHANRPVTISDVVAHCRCSRSTLFNAFHRHRGYTPMGCLMEARLKLAREALLRPAPGDTVTSIALACGFMHFGRFAESYRERYGEKPSETLRKA